MAQRTKGIEALKTAMRRAGLTQGKLAALLGHPDSGVVNRWVNGNRVPGLTGALELQRRLGIDPSLWLQPEVSAESGPDVTRAGAKRKRSRSAA